MSLGLKSEPTVSIAGFDIKIPKQNIWIPFDKHLVILIFVNLCQFHFNEFFPDKGHRILGVQEVEKSFQKNNHP